MLENLEKQFAQETVPSISKTRADELKNISELQGLAARFKETPAEVREIVMARILADFNVPYTAMKTNTGGRKGQKEDIAGSQNQVEKFKSELPSILEKIDEVEELFHFTEEERRQWELYVKQERKSLEPKFTTDKAGDMDKNFIYACGWLKNITSGADPKSPEYIFYTGASILSRQALAENDAFTKKKDDDLEKINWYRENTRNIYAGAAAIIAARKAKRGELVSA